MGLSLLGNLDGMYKHSMFPDIKLHTLTTGSRQRSGGMLLFGYTFVQKLWVNFGYDENGFEEDTVKRFWKNVIDAIQEFLTWSRNDNGHVCSLFGTWTIHRINRP